MPRDIARAVSVASLRPEDRANDESQCNEEKEGGKHLHYDGVPALGISAAVGRVIVQIARGNVLATFAADGGQGH